MDTNCFNDQTMMGDVLSTQKFIVSGYNYAATEACGATVKNTMMSLLDEEQSLQHEIFMEMKNRGWYPTEAADQNKINQAKQKFCSDCKTCSCS